MLTDNPDNGSGLLEFADQFEAVTESTNEITSSYHKEGDLVPIYLVPRRAGVLAPISESSDEDILGTGTNRTTQIQFHIDKDVNPVVSNFSNKGEQVTSKICDIL